MKRASTDILSYTAVIQEDAKGHHLVSFPALPGCHTFGRTFEEAVRMGQEVLGLWLEELAASGDTLPREWLGKDPCMVKGNTLLS